MKTENDTDDATNRNGKGQMSGGAASGGQRRSGREKNRRGRSRSPLDRSGSVSTSGSRASRRVYVANVPFDVKWSELKDLFRDKIGNVVYCQLFEDEQGRSRGCGLVEFSDTESAQKAIEVLHRFEFRNRELVVKEDLDCERDRYGRLLLPGKGRDKDEPAGRHNDFDAPASGQSQQQGYDQSLQGGAWNTYGLSPQFLESLGVRGPLNNRIFVANLDYKVGEKKLEEIFKLAGKTLRVRLYTDSTGQSKGHGTVEFEHPVEAVQAISMFHNQKLYGRPMSIRMDKYETEEVAEELPSKLPAGLEGIGKGLGIGGQPLNIAKSLLGAAPPISAITPAPVPQVNPVAPSLTALNQLQSLPTVPSALNQLVQQPQVASAMSLNMAVGMDQRSSSITPSLSSNGMLSYPSLSSNSTQVRVNPTLGLAPVQNTAVASSVYEREFRDPSIGLRPQAVQPVHPTSDTVVVRNLPQTVSWQSLRDRFSEFGDVRFAELKGVGVAIVRFHTERDAQRAVDLMNGSRFENRVIEVSLY